MKYRNRKVDFANFWKRTLFFIIAFIPLWVILIANYALSESPNGFVIMGSSITLVLALSFMIVYLDSLRKSQGDHQFIKIVQKSSMTHDVVFYTLAYIPVLLLTTYDIRAIVTFSIILFTVYVLYIKTNMLHINPILALMKYNIYKVTDDHDNTIVLLSKLHLKTGTDVAYKEITDNISMVPDDES